MFYVPKRNFAHKVNDLSLTTCTCISVNARVCTLHTPPALHSHGSTATITADLHLRREEKDEVQDTVAQHADVLVIFHRVHQPPVY